MVATQFAVFVDDTRAANDWITRYRAQMRGHRSGHQIDIRRNEIAMPGGGSGEDAYLDFPWIIECVPTTRHVSEDQQIELARTMRDVLKSLGCIAVVAANFEDQV
jgi:hypothetical protein